MRIKGGVKLEVIRVDSTGALICKVPNNKKYSERKTAKKRLRVNPRRKNWLNAGKKSRGFGVGPAII